MSERHAKRHLIGDAGFAIALLAVVCAASYFFDGAHRTAAVIGSLFSLSGYILLAGVERLLPPAGPRKSTRRWWMHLHITLAISAVAIPVSLFFGSFLAGVVAKRLSLNLGLIDLTFDKSYGVLGLIAAVILGAVVWDFFYYWYHRALHKSAILWQHHKMHHIDPEFDALTALRLNPMEDVLAGFFVTIPFTILFKGDSTSIAEAGIVNGMILYALWMSKVINHSNLRMQFGKASFLWVSSQTHRIHHSRLPEHLDKNFAAFFPLWDVIFGTYYALNGMSSHPQASKGTLI